MPLSGQNRMGQKYMLILNTQSNDYVFVYISSYPYSSIHPVLFFSVCYAQPYRSVLFTFKCLDFLSTKLQLSLHKR